ncbi:MAG TPA: tetrahydrofolate dehydrogenase/cyclohydrolase catalytic domain-containing protein, partial [Dongiaceae bacterium]|nr:tetrahydrofolate dehydrogenase/cyclohydrolase catalytic domain-containing protein [Dongiaceae bacterium]
MVDNQIIDGRKVANGILAELAEQVEDLKQAGWGPKLNSITIGEVDAVGLYVRNQKRSAEKAGLLFEEHHFPAEITQDQMLAAISAMNADPRVTGIILQRPVPHHLSIKLLQAAIHPL